jgi:Tfp pilus assembly protein PilE
MTRLSRPNPSLTRAGLTLVEMLVVVASMAIALAVLLPTLTSVRAEGHRAGCQQNLIDLGRAFGNYLAENDNRLPRARPLAPPILGSTGRPPLTVAMIGQLSATTNAYHCPGDSGALYTTCGMSYYYDTWLSGVDVAQLNTDPAGVPLMWDADNDVFLTRRGPVAVPRFHEHRQSLFADLHVGRVGDERTVMH